jgi:MFS family permease
MTLPLDRHWRNVLWILSVETMWGPALALISVVAIVPVFLSHLGASNTVLGALPVVWTLASSLPQAFAAHFTGHLKHRKRVLILLHIAAAPPWIALAAWFGLGGLHTPALDIVALLLGWSLAWLIMGFTIPVWINFIGKVTRPELRARSFGTIFFFQTLLGIAGGWVASRILGGGIPYPQNYGLGFLIAGICMAAGALFFLPVVEEESATEVRGQMIRTVLRHMREVMTDRSGVRTYLAIQVLSAGGWLLVTYYPVFAEGRLGLTARHSALFTATCMAGQMLGSVLVGWVGDRLGYSRVAVIAVAALTLGLALSIWGTGLAVYFGTAFALGVYLVSDRLALFNLSMAFSPHDDNTAYIGAIPALTAPMLAIAAGSAGPFIDRFGYLAVAWVGLGAAAVALYLVALRLPEPPYSLAGRRKAAG